MRNKLAALALAGALVFGPAQGALAQTETPAAQEQDDGGGDAGLWGLLGLLGLAGLAGLRRPRHDDRINGDVGTRRTRPIA